MVSTERVPYGRHTRTLVHCDCGSTVLCVDGLWNQCGCGAGYNAFGQPLAPPEQWEAEDRSATFGPRNQEDGFDG